MIKTSPIHTHPHDLKSSYYLQSYQMPQHPCIHEITLKNQDKISYPVGRALSIPLIETFPSHTVSSTELFFPTVGAKGTVLSVNRTKHVQVTFLWKPVSTME